MLCVIDVKLVAQQNSLSCVLINFLHHKKHLQHRLFVTQFFILFLSLVLQVDQLYQISVQPRVPFDSNSELRPLLLAYQNCLLLNEITRAYLSCDVILVVYSNVFLICNLHFTHLFC